MWKMKTTWLAIASTALVSAALTACSAASHDGDVSGGPSRDDAGSTNLARDGGASPNDAAPATSASRDTGSIVVRQDGSSGQYSANAYARFMSSPAGDSSVTCAISAAGPACTLTKCDGFPASDVTSDDAGEIRLNGGSAALTLDYGVLEPGAYVSTSSVPTFPLASPTTPLFAGGETLGFDATGGAVPAFHGSLRAPKPVSLTSPTFDAQNNCPMPQGRDVDFTWTAGAPDDVMEIVVHGASLDENVTCRFDASAAHGTVPFAGALDTIEADAAGNQFVFTTTVTRSTQVVAGDYAVSLRADALALACYARLVP